MKALVVNSGSSSQKAALIELSGPTQQREVSVLWSSNVEVDLQTEDRQEIIKDQIENFNDESPVWSIDVIGHRIVHGGEKYRESTLVTADLQSEIEKLVELAPIHNGPGLEGITAMNRLLPDVPQVAVFDTSVHRNMPPYARTYALPYELFEVYGVQKFGFHGINHGYCYRRCVELLTADQSDVTPSTLRVVTCHLGGGCSLAAMQNGFSLDTTMGFTPLEGIVMSTRSGSIDPGILIYLQRHLDLSVEDIENLLNKESGLKGISGFSGDMREVIKAAQSGNLQAELAIEIYVHSLAKGIASMTASLGGIDALVFTGGVGENSELIREKTCKKLAFLGVKMDSKLNSSIESDCSLSSADSAVSVMVIFAKEDIAIARECYKVMQDSVKAKAL